MAKGVTMYNQSDQSCCLQPQGQHNYRLFLPFFPPLKDTFQLPTIWSVCLYWSETEKDVQAHLEGQQQREEMAGARSNGQDQVTSKLVRAKEK